MELRIILSIVFTGLVFLSLGFFAYLKPAHFGGDFKLVRTPKFVSLQHDISSNTFVVRYAKIIGIGIMIAGFLAIVFAVIYSFYPDILMVLSYTK